jgi:predicted amidohydrolase YtcJ
VNIDDRLSVQAPLLVTGGPIWTGRRTVEALGVAGGRVVAAGELGQVRDALCRGYRVLDVEGRRVIPGLIDSHTHFVRAGLTWDRTIRWDDIGSLEEGLARVGAAAGASADGSAAAGGGAGIAAGAGWLRVLGGWHPGRLSERRGPTAAEWNAVAGNRPAYLQLLYEEGLLNDIGMALLLADGDVPGVERAADGTPTGWIRGPAAFGRVQALFDQPSPDEQLASTAALASAMAARGITGVVDPGGLGMTPESYATVFRLWRERRLGVRVRLYVMPTSRGGELDDIRAWMRYVQPGFGDGMLRYIGLGEVPVFGCHDMEGVRPFEITDEALGALEEISLLAAAHGWPIHMHAILDSTITAVLDVWERIDGRVGLAGRRFSLAHADALSPANLARVRRLGIGLAIQNRLMYRAADSGRLWGEEQLADSPPLRDIVNMGIPWGAGTDATVVSPFDPWLCLWWLVTGQSFDGAPPRGERHRLTVEEALAAYPAGSAWFSFEEDRRGHLETGADADLAVLNLDPFTTEPDALPTVSADLTLLGGASSHVGADFAGWGDPAR